MDQSEKTVLSLHVFYIPETVVLLHHEFRNYNFESQVRIQTIYYYLNASNILKTYSDRDKNLNICFPINNLY